MPKVSVIVPVYNVEQYLEKCVSSLVNQTLEDIEILLINDGSTDRSGEICAQLEVNFPNKIRSFTKVNGGLSDARNFGLDRISGDYVGFVDSDDYVTPDMFMEMHQLAKKYQAEMVICNLQKVNEAGTITQKLPQIPHLPEQIDLSEHLSVFADLSYFACNKLFHKDLFQSMRFKKNMHFEDIELIPQILLKCKTLAQTQKFHYQYLERQNSISKTHTERGIDILAAVSSVENAYKKSVYSNRIKELKSFQILEGIYTFLAYTAFVKDEKTAENLHQKYCNFRKKRGISLWDILTYSRFGENYLLSLPWKKKIYYLFYFFGLRKLLKKLI